MSFLKKNLLFCIVVVICLVAFAGGVFMAIAESGAVKEARGSIASAETQLNSLLNTDPAPTEENVAAAEKNLAELQAALAELREDLQSGTELDTSDDGVSVIAGIQQYISKFQKETEEHVNEEGEAVPIETPDDFAFGFEQYIDEATPPEDPAKISQLDKQRQILRYLLTQLMQTDPQSIDAVKREVLESRNANGDNNRQGFSIDPAISARVPGAIDTMAFSLTFSGYTDSLRDFLNRLARFELPLVVRSIQVTRPGGGEIALEPPRRNDPGNVFDLFGEADAPARSGDAASGNQRPTPEQKPVIEENISRFTVILEFIEVVLPDAPNQEVSDPA